MLARSHGYLGAGMQVEEPSRTVAAAAVRRKGA